MYDWFGLVGLFFVGVVAGAINSVAGGGILLIFPSLVTFGESEIVSNTTSTAGLGRLAVRLVIERTQLLIVVC